MYLYCGKCGYKSEERTIMSDFSPNCPKCGKGRLNLAQKKKKRGKYNAAGKNIQVGPTRMKRT